MPKIKINIGRKSSGGIFNGLFGNPIKEHWVSEQYREHLQVIMLNNPDKVIWLRDQLACGAVLYCPGCGINSPTCHARIIEQEL